MKTSIIMNRYLRFLAVFTLLALAPALLKSQEIHYSTQNQSFASFGTVVIRDVSEDWNFRIDNLEGIQEGNSTYRQHLMQLKKESALRFPGSNPMLRTGVYESSNAEGSNVTTPVVHRNFQGNAYSFSAPNDNTLAVSNGGYLISAINTNIYFYDLNKDSLLKSVTLNVFCSDLTGISSHQYDPKLIYDPDQDRFILVFLAGSSSDTKTNIIVAFSETSDVLGKWNLYTLPGNPLNDTSWTDYPAIALTRDELFITGNLLNYGTSWQTSFRQSVIWQVNKFDGYSGNLLNTRLWKDIIFDGVNIRNINPIQGADQLSGPNIYLLSNRNFTLYSDSIFFMEVTGNIQQADARLTISCLKADVGYGAPPDAKQPNNNNVLATNDARVLGGFLHNKTIQFVANSIDTTSGKAVIYHGIISDVGRHPSVKGKLIIEPGMEFGYPNISYTGSTLFSQQAIIGFNHTGDTVYPGISVIFYDGSGGYSDRVVVKRGEVIIDIFSTTYERWGDYTGNQRKYNEPGTVWVSGMFGTKVGLTKRLGTQIAEVVSGVKEAPVITKGKHLDASLYPNPVIDQFGMEFELATEQDLIIELKSLTGQREHLFYAGKVKAGKNALTFSTQNLAQGVHILVISDADGKVLFSEKVLKVSN